MVASRRKVQPSDLRRNARIPHISDTPSSHQLQVPESLSGVMLVVWYIMIALTILLALFVVLVHNTSWPRIIIVLSMPVLLYRYSSQDTRPPFTAAKAQAIQPTGSVRQISNALSQSEAKHYMQQGLSLMGTGASGVSKDPQALAQQSRPMGTQVAMIGPEVSHIMWERLAHLFEPIELSADDQTIDQSGDPTLAGRWHPVGLNSCWRVSSFRPGARALALATQSMDFGCEDGRVCCCCYNGFCSLTGPSQHECSPRAHSTCVCSLCSLSPCLLPAHTYASHQLQPERGLPGPFSSMSHVQSIARGTCHCRLLRRRRQPASDQCSARLWYLAAADQPAHRLDNRTAVAYTPAACLADVHTAAPHAAACTAGGCCSVTLAARRICSVGKFCCHTHVPEIGATRTCLRLVPHARA